MTTTIDERARLLDCIDYVSEVLGEWGYNEVYIDVMERMKDFESVEDAASWVKDICDHGCISGVYTSLIYEYDICNFFYDHAESINDVLYDMQRGTGDMLVLDMEWVSSVHTHIVWTVIEYAAFHVSCILDEWSDL